MYGRWVNPVVFQSHHISYVAAKFVLEVLGAAGAIWGSSEILYLRDDATKPKSSNTVMWRHIALAIGAIFFIRFYYTAKHTWNHQRFYYLPIKLHDRRVHMLPFFHMHPSLS